jgi:hypothetical protein
METMPAPVMDPAVVMRLSRRRAIERSVFIALYLVLWLSVFMRAVVPLDQTGPADYAGQLVFDVGLAFAVSVPAALGLASRRVALQPAGPKDGVGWDEVTAIAVVSSVLTQAVRLHLRSGRSLRMALPEGSPWRRDRAFRAEVEFVRAYAVAHGAVLGSVQSRRFRTLLVSVIALLVIGAGIGLHVVQRGAIWPWSPLATAPPACPALASELDRLWPTSQRRLTVDDQATCTWETIAGDSAFLGATVTITAKSGDRFLANPVSRANQTYLDDLGQYRDAALTTLTDVGDQAFIHTSGPDDVAEARVANILLVVQLTRRSEQTGAAEEILRHLVAETRVERGDAKGRA